jgi:hypothetical protein
MGLPPGSRLPPVVQTALVVHDPVGFFLQNTDAPHAPHPAPVKEKV